MDSRCFLNLTGYWQDQNIQDILVHTSIKSQSGSPAGTYPCDAPRCRMCVHVSATTILNGPRHNITIRAHFTCKTNNVVYCISCLCCLVLYIGGTGRMLRECTGKHLRAIMRNLPGFPVAEHFNKPRHRLEDMEVRCVKQCRVLTTADAVMKCPQFFILAPFGHMD